MVGLRGTYLPCRVLLWWECAGYFCRATVVGLKQNPPRATIGRYQSLVLTITSLIFIILADRFE